ncbi:hypothetical protein [Fictibacillus sp. NRS-1165]|uniref:hypothetical protein n=1 Tax=Fictibacillus sp. NRS-1165 TaxID=3144463 RepID=UPI003D190F0F
MARLMDLSYKSQEVTRQKVDWLSDRIQPVICFKMPNKRKTVTVENPRVNLFNKDTVTTASFVNYTTGAIGASSAGNTASDWISVNPSTPYVSTGLRLSASAGVAFYDSDKKYISGTQQPTWTTPSNAVFMRVTVNNAELNTASVMEDRPDSESHYEFEEGRWIEFPLGIFLLSTPVRKEVNQEVYREVDAYDGLVVLEEDKFSDRYTIKAGSGYYSVMVDILSSAGIKKYNVEFSDKVLPNDMEYEPGTSKRSVLNDLASQINFTPFWVDEYGYYTSSKYVSPQDKTPSYEYIDDLEMSVVFNGMEEELDLYSVPNVWTVVYSNIDSEGTNTTYLRSSYRNENPDSITSIPSRGRNIVDYREVENIADQESLDAYTERIAFEASQVYGKLQFTTAIMPFHRYADTLYIRNSNLAIDGKYSETSWSIPFDVGGEMRHEVRKVVMI